MLTVGEFIVSAENYGVRCIAGFDGIDRIATSFSIIDSPEILQWVRGGEVLVDCGYITSTQPQMMVGLIEALKKHNCAALGVKLHRYWDKIPAVLIEDGNRLHFPVIQLPYEVRFSDFAYTLHKSIFESELNDNQIASFAYMDIVKSFCKYKSVRRLLYDLNMLLKRPMLLVDTEFRLLGMECRSEEALSLGSVFHLDGNSPIISAARMREIYQKYERSSFQSTHEVFQNSTSALNCLILSIRCSAREVYFLVIPEYPPLKNWEYQFLSNMEILFLFCLSRGRQDELPERRSFSALLSKHANLQEKDIVTLCKSAGFDYVKKRCCLTVLFQNTTALSMVRYSLLRDIIIQISDWISTFLMQNFYLCEYENCRIYYLLFPNEIPAGEIFACANEIAKHAMELFTKSGFACKIGISGISADLSQIAGSFYHTLDLIDLGRKLFPEEQIFTSNQLQVYLWLRKTMRREELEQMCQSTVKPLQEHSTPALDYVQILEKYIENRYNVSKTASELHFHRNTLINYLARIQQLLPLSMDDPENMVKIQLGLRALRVLSVE